MKAFITEHQLNQIFFGIRHEYDCFGTQKIDDKLIFDALDEHAKIVIPTPKTIIPFKKILWPNKQNINGEKSTRKIALIGLTNCDANALEILLKKFSHTDLLPLRENILVISTQCLSDDHCFCTSWGLDTIEKFDLHIQKEATGYSIFAGSPNGEKILKTNHIAKRINQPKLKKITLEGKELIDQKELPLAVSDKARLMDYWTIVANNCFGCGSCSTVCPLCFCVRQNFHNTTTGACKPCLDWDSCFAKDFSEIQNHHDFRPTNLDRLYDWYHHKFVRSPKENKTFLCTGCGRCIEACPAFLNQYRIIQSLIKKEEQIN